jgi:hypothetical protein
VKARIDAGGFPLVFGGGFGGHFGIGGAFMQLDAAASYLGLTEAQLRAQLANGKTLAQIANDRNKSVSGLVAAMTAAAKKQLDAAVAAGKLSQSQADGVLKDLQQRITDIVNGKRPTFGGGPFRGVRPFGGGFGEFHRYRGPTF